MKTQTKSYSQNRQDLQVITLLKHLKNGYFIDIGCSHPIKFSNTYLLEKEFGWTGLCVDAIDHSDLYAKERSCFFENSAIYKYTGKVSFIERNNPVDGYNMISSINDMEVIPRNHGNGNCKLVNCITIRDLFEKYNVPKKIDYFSMDVEGSELLVFEQFPWDYRISVITFEDSKSEFIEPLLIENGYRKEGKWGHDLVFVDNNLNV